MNNTEKIEKELANWKKANNINVNMVFLSIPAMILLYLMFFSVASVIGVLSCVIINCIYIIHNINRLETKLKDIANNKCYCWTGYPSC